MYLLLEFVTKHSQILARVAFILLLVLITASVADTVLFAIDNVAQEPASSPPPTRDQTRRSAAGSRASIAEYDLFGTPGPTQGAADVPQTNLNLTLEGVFTARNAAESTAIVAEANNPGSLYRVGDSLPGRVTLNSVHNDHIVIQRGTRYETLSFLEESRSNAGYGGGEGIDLPLSDSATEVPENDAVPDVPQADTEPPNSDADEEQTKGNSYLNRRRARGPSVYPPDTGELEPGPGSKPPQASIGDVMNKYRQRLDTDPKGVLAELGVEPVTGRSAGGYRLGSEIPSQQLQQAGLMPGDIVLSVNGKAVGDVMQDRALIDQSIAAGRVRVEIQRQDRRFFVTVPVRTP